MFWLNQSNQFVQRFYIGPCIGKKIYRSGKAIDMVFPNVSLGFGLIHYRNQDKDPNGGYRGMFSGRGGCLLVLKRLPVSIEPCMNISVSAKQLIAIPSLRIGITKDFKKIH